MKNYSTHPLTDRKLFKKFWDHTVDAGEVTYTPGGMRKAADWQLRQVMKWLDANLNDYTDNNYLNDCKPFYELMSDLKEAMRPTTQEES